MVSTRLERWPVARVIRPPFCPDAFIFALFCAVCALWAFCARRAVWIVGVVKHRFVFSLRPVPAIANEESKL